MTPLFHHTQQLYTKLKKSSDLLVKKIQLKDKKGLFKINIAVNILSY